MKHPLIWIHYETGLLKHNYYLYLSELDLYAWRFRGPFLFPGSQRGCSRPLGLPLLHQNVEPRESVAAEALLRRLPRPWQAATQVHLRQAVQPAGGIAQGGYPRRKQRGEHPYLGKWMRPWPFHFQEVLTLSNECTQSKTLGRGKIPIEMKMGGDLTFAPATITPAMISPTTES